MDYAYEDYENYKNEEEIIIHCYCEGHCPSNEEQGICQVTSGGKCFTAVEAVADDYGDEYPVLSYGCFGAGTMGLMQFQCGEIPNKCKANVVPHAVSKSIQCCDVGDFCNKNLFPMYAEKTSTNNTTNLPSIVLLSSCITCFVFVIIIISAVFFMYKKKEKQVLETRKEIDNNNQITENAENDVIVTNLEFMDSIGDGPSMPTMVQRTIAQQIEMGIPIGTGRFGEVWLAKWREEKVAVKIFFITEQKYWFTETDIYQTVLMRHENILGFIAADIKASARWTELLLITDYHDHGSLYGFLQRNTLSPQSLLTKSMSVARGLTHLHTEIFGIHGKPAIAHRDIRSKNILVKKNGECCIADFGLAVKFDSSSNKFEVPHTEKCGATRYMAPEMLDGRMDFENFDSLKSVDMYACGLVFWEMAWRCDIGDNPAYDYMPPFNDNVPDDPTLEQMQEIICVNKIRPHIPNTWYSVEILQILAKSMQELWHENPAVRLTALRVKKTLSKLNSVEDVTVDMEEV